MEEVLRQARRVSVRYYRTLQKKGAMQKEYHILLLGGRSERLLPFLSTRSLHAPEELHPGVWLAEAGDREGRVIRCVDHVPDIVALLPGPVGSEIQHRPMLSSSV